MKVTQAMIEAFGETLERVPRREIEEGIQAVLDLIERDQEAFAAELRATAHDDPERAHGTADSIMKRAAHSVVAEAWNDLERRCGGFWYA